MAFRFQLKLIIFVVYFVFVTATFWNATDRQRDVAESSRQELQEPSDLRSSTLKDELHCIYVAVTSPWRDAHRVEACAGWDEPYDVASRKVTAESTVERSIQTKQVGTASMPVEFCRTGYSVKFNAAVMAIFHHDVFHVYKHSFRATTEFPLHDTRLRV